jgi:hypothetical protein
MAKTALNQLQDQIDAVRQEAYAAGYAAAMQTVRELVSKAAPGATTAPAAPQRRQGTGRRGRPPAAAKAAAAATPAAPPTRKRQPRVVAKAKAPARAPRAGSRPSRGNNARMIEEILQAAGSRALRPAEIRSALQKEKGVSMAFTSIRHALGQLEGRNVAEQVGDSKTWRHLAGGAA